MPNEIYDFLVKNNLTQKSEPEFKSEYSVGAKAKELHSFFVSNNLTTKDYDSFYDEYLSTGEMHGSTKRAAEAANEYKESLKKKDATESVSDDGLSVYQKISGGKSVISEGLAGKYDKKKEEPSIDLGVISTTDDLLKYQKQQAEKEPVEITAEQKELNGNINWRSIGQSEEDVVNFLTEKYGDEFLFEEIGFGNYIRIKPLDNLSEAQTFRVGKVSDPQDYIMNSVRGIKEYISKNRSTEKRKALAKANDLMTDLRFEEQAELIDSFKVDRFVQPVGTEAMTDGIQQPAMRERQEIEFTPQEIREMNKIFEAQKDYLSTSARAHSEEILKAKKRGKVTSDDEAARELRYTIGAMDPLAMENLTKNISREATDIAVKFKRNEEERARIQNENAKLKQRVDRFGLDEESKAKAKELEQDLSVLTSYEDSLKADLTEIVNMQENLTDAMIVSAMAKENEGNLGGAITNGFIKGTSYIGRLAGMSRQDQEKLIEWMGDPTVTPEWMSSEDRDFWEKLLPSLSESVGIMASSALTGPGAGIARAAGFYAQAYYGMKDEIDQDPNFKDVPEYEKEALASLYGVTIGALEKFGIEFAMGKTLGKEALDNIAKQLMRKTFSKSLPKNASAELIEAEIKRDLKKMIADGSIRAIAASGAEGVTETTQELADISLRSLYNMAKGEEVFDNVNWEEFPERALEAGLMGLVGGAIFSGIGQSKQIVSEGFRSVEMTDDIAKTLQLVGNDSKFRSLVSNYIRTEMLSGRLDKETAESVLNSYDEMMGRMNKIPKDVNQVVDAFDLLTEKEKLQKEIEGKDKALTSAQQNRINQIDEQLKTISENAVQEQSTAEVSDVEASRVSEEVEEGAPTTEPEVVTEEGKKEVISGVEITYPTEQQKEERIAERTNPTYVEESANKLQEEDVDVLSKELEGEFGLLTAENPMAQPLTEQENASLNEKAIEWLESRGYNPRRVTGKYVQAENSFFVPNLTRDDAIAFAKEFNQESVAHSDGVIYQDGSINPRVKEQDSFSFEEYSPQSDYVSVIKTKDGLRTFSVGYNFFTKVISYRFDEKISPQPTANQITVDNELEFIQQAADKDIETVEAAGRAVKALEKTGTKVFLHKTTDEYNQAIAESVGTTKEAIDAETMKSRGEFITGKNEIHINLENADVKTVFHEAFHAVVATGNASKTDIDAMSDAIRKGVKDKDLKDRAASLSEMYEEGEVNEEFLSELVGIMSSEEVMANPTLIQKIMAFVNKITRGLFGKEAATRQDYIDFINDVSTKLRRGEDITTTGISSTIQKPTRKAQLVEHTGEHDLSYVSKDDIIDIDSLIDDIIAKNQKVWFWVADQLGRGMYYDNVLDNEHYLDAGPSYPLDPKNRKDKKIWATGISKKAAEKAVTNNDYIFIISGSPEKSKLFNKQVAGITKQRIENKVKYSTFKKNMMKVGTKKIKDIVSKYDSYEDLFNSTDRKPMLLEILDQSKKPNSKAHKLLKKYDAFVDPDQLRDGFYKDNGFEQNDIMIVLKPTEVGGKSEHSTYEFDIIGEVVGVPNKKVNAYELMPEDVKAKYDESMARAMQQQVVAPYGIGTEKKIERKKQISIKKLGDGFEYIDEKSGDGSYVEKYRDYVEVTKPENISLVKPIIKEVKKNYKGLPIEMYMEYKLEDPEYKKVRSTLEDEGLKLVSMVKPMAQGGEYSLTYSSKPSRKKQIKGEQEDIFSRASRMDSERLKLKSNLGIDFNDITVRLSRVLYGDDRLKSSTIENERVIEEMMLDIIYKESPSSSQIRNRKSLINKYKELHDNGVISESMHPYEVELKIAIGEKGFDNLISYYKPSRKKQISGDGKKKAMDDAKAKYELSKKRGNSEAQARESAIADLKKNDWYKESTDIERENAVRELREDLGFKKEKKAPSAAKITGKPKPKRVTVSEVSALKDQIRLEARAAREGAKFEKDVRKKIAKTLKDMMDKTPRIFNQRQVKAIYSRALNMNLSNPKMEEKFIEYVEKVINDAEYVAKVYKALENKSRISKRVKSKGKKQASLVSMGKEFTRINPHLVEDIDKYLSVSEEVLEGLTNSNLRGGKINIRNTPEIKAINDYTKEQIAIQEEIEKNTLLELFPELVEIGLINESMSINEIRSVIRLVDSGLSKEEGGILLKEKDTQKIITKVKEIFTSLQGDLEIVLNDKVDPYTGESIELSETAKSALESIVEISSEDITLRESLEIIDMMTNFITNGVIDNIDSVTSYLKGRKNAKIALEVAVLKDYSDLKWGITRTYDKYFATLPLLAEKMTGSPERAAKLLSLMGVNDFRQGVVKARLLSEKFRSKYVEQFNKTKPNNKEFSDPYNVYERGMYAFLTRNLNGTQEEKIKEFNRRIDIVKQTIDDIAGKDKRAGRKLSDKGIIYKQIAEDLGMYEDSFSFVDLESRVAKENKSAVEYWVSAWADHYSDVSDIARSIYNKELGSDFNYTPDKYIKIDGSSDTDVLMGSFGNFDGIYMKESGSLMDITRPEAKSLKNAGRVVDLTFDQNNMSAFEAALTDIYTAKAAKQINGFLNSEEFSELFNKENRDILESRIKSFVMEERGRAATRISEEERFAQRISASLAKISTSLGLGGVSQAIKQTAPVIVATMIQTKGKIDLREAFKTSAELEKWMSEGGVDIAVRGLEASSLAKITDKDVIKMRKKLDKLGQNVDAITEFYLKNFLANPDKAVAKASFLAHYKHYMKIKGLNTDVDYSKPMDKEAAAYAQQMVDRHQNVSLSSLQGEMFTKKGIESDILRNVFLPFANFILNQKVRFASNAKTFFQKGSTRDDKTRAFIDTGSAVMEIIAYRIMAQVINSMIKGITYSLMGWDPEDEDPDINEAVDIENASRDARGLDPMTKIQEAEFRTNMYSDKELRKTTKTTLSNLVTDIFSPAPVADNATLKGFNKLLSTIPGIDPSESDINKAIREMESFRKSQGKDPMTTKQIEKFREDYIKDHSINVWDRDMLEKSLGKYSIGSEKAMEAFDILSAIRTGKITTEYQGRKTEKIINKEDKDKLKWIFLGKMAYLSRLAPTEIGYSSDRAFDIVKKSALTDTKNEKLEILNKITDGVTDEQYRMIKDTNKGLSTIIDETVNDRFERARLKSKLKRML